MRKLSCDAVVSNVLKALSHGDGSVVFIDTADQTMVSSILQEKEADLPCLYHYTIPEFFKPTPFFPLLDIIVHQWKKRSKPASELLELCPINYIHQQMFEDYFSWGTASRKEEIQMDQIFYDRRELARVLKALFSLLFQDQASLFYFQGLESLSLENIQLLEDVLDHSKTQGHGWILEMNSSQGKENFKTNLGEIKDWIHRKEHSIFFFSTLESESPSFLPKKEPVPFSEIFIGAGAKILFLDLKEAENDLRRLVTLEGAGMSGLTLLEIEYQLGLSLFLQEKTDQAITLWNRLLEQAMEEGNTSLLARIYRRLGECYREQQNIEMAKKLVLQAIKMAKSAQDRIEIFRGECLFLSAVLVHANQDEYPGIMEIFYHVVYEGKALDSPYLLARALGNFIADNNVVAYHIVDEEVRMEWCDRGIQISQEIGNHHLLGALYHNKAVILSNMGKNKEAFHFYRKSEYFKKMVGNPREIVRIYNGFGYACFLQGDFKRALSYYTKSIWALVEVQDYLEICLTIFNICETFFYARKFDQAVHYAKMMIKMMKILSIEKLPFHSIFEAYGMMALSYFEMGNTIKAMDIAENIRRENPPLGQKENNYFLLLNGKLEGEDSLKIALEQISAQFSAKEYFGDRWLNYLWAQYEIAKGLWILGYTKEGIKHLEKVMQEHKGRVVDYYLKLYCHYCIQPDLAGKEKIPALDLKNIRIDFHALFQIVHTKMAMNKLNNKINDINFLNNLQQRLLDSTKKTDQLIPEILNLIFDVFVAERVVLFLAKDHGWEHYSLKRLTKDQLQKIRSTFLSPPKDVLIASENRELLATTLPEYQSVITLNIPGVTGSLGVLFLATEKRELNFSQDDYDILSLSTRQIGTSLDNRILMERLAQHSYQMEDKNKELEEVIHQLVMTQNQLVESEKMASLGSLVAGVAHEINTPLGISITSSTYIEEVVQGLRKSLDNQEEVEVGKVEKPLRDITEAIKILNSNLNRSASLVKSFKQVAVDQSLDDQRVFNLHDYLEEILTSLSPTINLAKAEMVMLCPSHLMVKSFPGVFYKIINNLVLNSVYHGLEGRKKGVITLEVKATKENLAILVSDNGKGMNAEIQKKIFDPFFTTRRNKGGVGLGMSIVFNLITQKLKGRIRLESTYGKGTLFQIDLPPQLIHQGSTNFSDKKLEY